MQEVSKNRSHLYKKSSILKFYSETLQ